MRYLLCALQLCGLSLTGQDVIRFGGLFLFEDSIQAESFAYDANRLYLFEVEEGDSLLCGRYVVVSSTVDFALVQNQRYTLEVEHKVRQRSAEAMEFEARIKLGPRGDCRRRVLRFDWDDYYHIVRLSPR